MIIYNLEGKTFGKLKVIKRVSSKKDKGGRCRKRWLCECLCGDEVLVFTANLISGITKSCGCSKFAFFGGRPIESAEKRFLRYLNKSSEDSCWVYTGSIDRKGYGVVSRGGRGATCYKAHRLSYELYKGPIPEGLCVCHRCDNPPCCNPSHLFLGTKGDNNRDMYAKGRNNNTNNAKGEHHALAKLNADKVREIRASWESEKPRPEQRELAKRYGVDQQVIWSVIHRKTWKHVT